MPGFQLLFIVAAVASAAVGRRHGAGWAATGPMRSFASAVALVAVLVGALTLRESTEPGEAAFSFGLAASIGLVAGGLLLIAGLWLPPSGPAHALRIAGWLPIAAVVLVPSTLTLFSPVVGAAAAVLLGSDDRQRPEPQR